MEPKTLIVFKMCITTLASNSDLALLRAESDVRQACDGHATAKITGGTNALAFLIILTACMSAKAMKIIRDLAILRPAFLGRSSNVALNVCVSLDLLLLLSRNI